MFKELFYAEVEGCDADLSESDAAIFGVACWRSDEEIVGATRPEVLAPAPPRVVACVMLHRRNARSILWTERARKERTLLFLSSPLVSESVVVGRL